MANAIDVTVRPAANTLTEIYTVPEGGIASVVINATMHDTSMAVGAISRISIAIGAVAGTAQVTDSMYRESRVPIALGDPSFCHAPLTLAAGTKIFAMSDTGKVNFTVNGNGRLL